MLPLSLRGEHRVLVSTESTGTSKLSVYNLYFHRETLGSSIFKKRINDQERETTVRHTLQIYATTTIALYYSHVQ
jgi:hypothetical protein